MVDILKVLKFGLVFKINLLKVLLIGGEDRILLKYGESREILRF